MRELGGERFLANGNGHQRAVPRATFELTEAERRVLSLAAAGYNKPEIAEVLRLSTETIKAHHKHIRAKLGVTTIQHAVTISLLIGEIDVDILREHLFRMWEG